MDDIEKKWRAQLVDYFDKQLQSADEENSDWMSEILEKQERILHARFSGRRVRPHSVDELTNENLPQVSAEEVSSHSENTWDGENYYQKSEDIRARWEKADNFEFFPDDVKSSPGDWKLKEYRFRENPGFDKCKWRVLVESINEAKCLAAIKSHAHTVGIHDYPFVEVTKAGSPDTAVTLPWNSKTYSKIDFILSPYAHFLFQHNNLPIRQSEEVIVEPKEISLLEVRVKPDTGYEDLGNFRNYSLEEEKEAIFHACDQLENMFGIRIRKDTIIAQYVEINLTFWMSFAFDALRVLSYYQKFLPKAFHSAQNTHPISQKYNYVVLESQATRDAGFTSQCLDGMTSSAKTVQINLYDKGYETVQHSQQEIRFRYLDSDHRSRGAYVRLEFAVMKRNPLNDVLFFDLGNKEREQRGVPLLSELSQERIDAAYTNLVNRYFGKPYERYVADAEEHLKKIIAGINPSFDRKWKEALLRELRQYEQHSHDVPLVLRNDDVDHLIKLNPIMKSHPGRYRDAVHEVLMSGTRYGKFDDPYLVLGEFFDKALRLHHLKLRTVTYAVHVDT